MTSLKDVYKVISGGGSIEEYSLLPYAKDIMYTDGLLRFTLVFFNETNEANMTMAFQLAPELQDQIEDLLGH